MVLQGVLRIKVIRGIDLAVRDFYSSDPYVKLSIGEHVAQTRVIRHDLNPRWDEELTLGIPKPPSPLKLFVFDWDRFNADDKMGEAQIDLSPLIAVAEQQEKRSFGEGMVIQKIVASKENNLVRDSVIMCRYGQIVQDVCIKLWNVEKGMIELELKWQRCEPCRSVSTNTMHLPNGCWPLWKKVSS